MAKKKKKQTYAEYMQETYGASNDYVDNVQHPLRKKQENNNDIAPVKTTGAKSAGKDSSSIRSSTSAKTTSTQGSGYFQKGALEDGFSWKNLGKAVSGTLTDAGEWFMTGLAGLPEKIADAGLILGASMNQSKMNEAANSEIIFNAVAGKKESATDTLKRYQNYQDDVEEETAKFVAKDLYDEHAVVAKYIVDPTEKKIGIDPTGADSFFADKMDSNMQSAGQYVGSRLLSLINPVFGYVATGLSAVGSEAENAFRNGATFDEANASAIITGGGEALSEAFFGGLSLGGQTFDAKLTKQIATAISSRAARTLAKLGVDMAGEGFEEIFSGVVGAIGQKLTYADEAEWEELFSSEDAFDSFVGGAMLGGFGSASKSVVSNIKGIDSTTGLTKNETNVVEKEVENRIAEKEKSSKKLTAKEKSKIRSEVMEELEKGGISTDTIESVLGGEDYKRYKSETERQEALRKELDELRNMEYGKMTDVQHDRLAELKAMKPNTEMLDTLKSSIDNKIRNELSADSKRLGKSRGSYLAESYNEVERRRQKFNVDLNQYSGKHKELLKNLVEKGQVNNTRKAHDFWINATKRGAERGLNVTSATTEEILEWTSEREGKKWLEENTEALIAEHGEAWLNEHRDELIKEHGDQYVKENFEGKIPNAFILDDGTLALNVYSNRVREVTFGHELGHDIKKGDDANGTGYYKELSEKLIAYAEKIEGKEAFAKRKAEATDLYANGLGEVNDELTNDLIGEYLYGDKNADFIKNLSIENKNLFQQLWDSIKYYYKIATAGSQEARDLLRIQKLFEKAYRETANVKTDAKGKVDFSLNIKHTDGTVEELADARDLTDERAIDYLYQAKSGKLRRDTYIPVRKDTPQVIIDTMEQVNEHIENCSMVMKVKKARDSMAVDNHNKKTVKYGDNVRKHGLSPEQIVEIVNKLDEPSMIIYETNRIGKDGEPLPNSVAVFVEYNNDGNEGLAVVEFENPRNTDSIGQEFGDTKYHTVVTVFEPDVFRDGEPFDYAEELLSDPNNFELKIKRRQSTESATGEKHPNTSSKLPSADGSLTQPKADVKTEFSLSVDSKGREIGDAVQKRFANSQVVDENGSLKAVYHGTASGEFTIFDKAKGSVEGDFGSGFYFTDNEFDVSNNYEGGGADFDNKVGRRADQIWNENPDIEYEEAEERAYKELYQGSHKFEVYLNIENPAIVGETNLLESEKYFSEYNQDDYDTEDDYYADVEQLVADDIENVIWEIERNVDVDNTDGISEILWNAFNEGGIGIEDLKKRLNNLYLEDSEGNLVANEVARQIIESLGYDGIIDPTVSNKWNMDMEAGTTHYIVFKPNQIKSVTNQNPTDNPDINLSLSYANEPVAKGAMSETALVRDIVPTKAVESVAPILEEAKTTAEPSNAAYEAKPIQEDIAPYTEPASDPSVAELDAQRAELEGKIMEALQSGDTETFEQLSYEHQALTERIAQIEEADAAFESERLASLDDSVAPIEQEAPIYDELPDATTLTKKAVSDIVKPVKDMFGLSGKQTAEVKAAVEKYATTENASVEELHESLVNAIGNTFEEDVPEVKAAQDFLRKNRLKVSDAIKNDIADYNELRKRHFGKIRFSKDGIDVDSAYEELTTLFPEFFPADIVNPSDQFMRMIEVSDMARTVETEYEVDNETITEIADIIINGINGYKQSQTQRLAEAEAKRIPKYAPGEDIAPVAYEAIKPQKPKAENYRLKRVDSSDYQAGNQQTASVLTEEAKIEKKNNRFWSIFKNKVLDKGSVFEDLSLKTKNRELIGKWNFTLSSESRAQRFMKNGSGDVKSLDSIRKEVESTGKTKQFYEYLYHKHNADRMTLAERYENTPNKAVFGDSVTAEMSQEAVAQLERENPEFKQFAEDVYNYNAYLRKLLVDNGVISQETAKLWSEMYPHYVPIRRVGDTGLNINVPLDSKKTGVNAPIKKATGGSSDILPLFDTMAQRTIQTYKAIAKNNFGVELKNTLKSKAESGSIGVDEIIDSIDSQDELLQKGKNGKNPTFTVFENGKRTTFEITEDMYDALKPVSEAMAYRNKILNTISNVHRGLLTEYNPVFMLTNTAKDIQDVLINSQHAIKTYANLPKAYGQILTKGKWYTEYMDNGGDQNSYFDNDSNTFEKEKSAIRKIVGVPLDVISAANNFFEMAPRLAEYIASRESGRSVEVSMLDAARVTTNFAAGGEVTKFLDGNGATFLNASLQGAMQQARNVREAKANGLKGWVSLATKFAVAGLPALLLNGLLWDDDEEYEELSDYVKQNYYVVAKTESGKFIRIPKGRALSVIQNAMEQVKSAATGDDEVDLKSFLELAISNLAPNNPIESNVLAPIIQVANNKTWYGEDLIPTRLQDLPAAEQFDESTDSISKWLGENLNYSPYKINYLLNQYSGGVGDVVLPMLTPEAESGNNSLLGNAIAPVKDKFTTDSVMNNQNISDFYDKVDELATLAKSSEATEEDILRYKYINSVNSELGELYARKREIQNSRLSDEAKYSAVRGIQEQIVSIAKEGLNGYETVSIDGKYAVVGDREYRLNEDGEWTKISDKQLERQNEVTEKLGISPSEYWDKTEISFMPRTDGEYEYAYENPDKYAVAKVVGDYDSYRTYTSELYDIKADYDSNGKAISGSAKAKKTEYINNLPLDYGQRIILYRSLFDSKADKNKYNADIVAYLDSRDDITWEEMKTILEALDMKVSDDGTVRW